jgi:hypothetical protein
MSDHAPDRRECRECGAGLTSWCCEVCGGYTLAAAADVSLSELVASWGRSVADSRGRGAGPRVVALH